MVTAIVCAKLVLPDLKGPYTSVSLPVWNPLPKIRFSSEEPVVMYSVFSSISSAVMNSVIPNAVRAFQISFLAVLSPRPSISDMMLCGDIAKASAVLIPLSCKSLICLALIPFTWSKSEIFRYQLHVVI
ncbi:hypothetical protein ES708_34845 [subsurface metagenome]